MHEYLEGPKMPIRITWLHHTSEAGLGTEHKPEVASEAHMSLATRLCLEWVMHFKGLWDTHHSESHDNASTYVILFKAQLNTTLALGYCCSQWKEIVDVFPLKNGFYSKNGGRSGT